MSRSSFAEALHDRLDAADIAAVAADLGATQRTVRSWARGERVPPPTTVFALERHLNLPPGTLSTHLGYLPAGTDDVSRGLQADATLMAREEVARYRADLPADAGALLDQVDVGQAARRGVQLEVLRALVREWEAAHGPLTERERQAAQQELGLLSAERAVP
jgi:hypothetical protein